MRNISVKLFRIWISGEGGDVVIKYFLSRAMAVILFGVAKLFGQF